MGRFCLVCLILIGILVAQALAETSEVKPSQVADRPALSPSSESSTDDGTSESAAEAPMVAIRRLGKHHSSDKSVAGGGVIIGGLVTATFAAVFCYIRVTRRKDGDHCSR